MRYQRQMDQYLTAGLRLAVPTKKRGYGKEFAIVWGVRNGQ